MIRRWLLIMLRPMMKPCYSIGRLYIPNLITRTVTQLSEPPTSQRRTLSLDTRLPSGCPWSFLPARRLCTKARYPPLNDSELEEEFVRGSGKGGQAVNKTSNCVLLKHIPTGIIIKCHAERSLEINRKIARKRLQMRLDEYYNGDESYVNRQGRDFAAKRAKKKEKTRKKLEKLRTTEQAEEEGTAGTNPVEVEGNMEIFKESPDRFKCIVLDLRKDEHACEDDIFEQKVKASVQFWQNEGMRAVSVFIPKELSSRISTLIKLEFDFHHANPGYVLLLKWLSKTDFNNFPAYANQYLAVAGFVVNDKKQVLVVRETYTLGEARWKLPGGGTDHGEDLHETARREVFEETGIDSEFQGVLCFRHLHNFRYGCSDFYYVSLMKALTNEIKPCTQEIAECQWMDLEEFAGQNLYSANQYIISCYKDYLKTGMFLKPTAMENYSNTGYQLMYKAEKVDKSESSKP